MPAAPDRTGVPFGKRCGAVSWSDGLSPVFPELSRDLACPLDGRIFGNFPDGARRFPAVRPGF